MVLLPYHVYLMLSIKFQFHIILLNHHQQIYQLMKLRYYTEKSKPIIKKSNILLNNMRSKNYNTIMVDIKALDLF